MKLSHVIQFDTVAARCVRAVVVIICMTMTVIQPGYCPTGQSGCNMDGMSDDLRMGVACLIACDVPLQAKDGAAPMLASSVSFVPRPVVAEQSGGHVEPDLPPPRTLM
jgi:hypothetical protein